MSYTLVGSRYIGTGSLPTPVAGYDAIDTTTGNQYVANTSGTAWVLVGNVNTLNLGLLPIAGGVMTGAITGATGWAPSDSPNFATKAYVAGKDVATTDELSALETRIMDSISPKITEAIASTTASVGVNSKIAKAEGILTFVSSDGWSIPPVQTVPLPTYPSGEVAKETECVWLVSPIELKYSVGLDRDYVQTFQYSTPPSVSRTFSAYSQIVGSGSSSGNIIGCKIGYMIIGVKA